MRLKKLWIDGFKNLNNFEIDFESRDGITVLIGNNASGKSNILEAISAISAGLYNAKLDKLGFKFDFIYEMRGADIRISKKQKIKYRIKKPNNISWNVSKNFYELDFALSSATTPKDLKTYYPSQVIALYSGEDYRLWEGYYKQPYLDRNKHSLNSDTNLHDLKMLYINKHYWDIALLSMYASDLNLLKIIDSELKEIKLVINIKLLTEALESKPINVVNNFVSDLVNSTKSKVILATSDKKILTTSDGKFLVIKDIIFNLNEFKQVTDYKTHEELFNLLSVAILPKKYKFITNLKLTFKNGTTTTDLSEGQKKQILLKLALDVLADEKSLLLFDEPDAHIHIANKKLIPEMLKEYEGKREVILTTHSPTLAHSFDNKHLAYVEDGQIKQNYNEKSSILDNLSNGLMGISEQQILLQSNKDILIVEGKTDEIHISTALNILKKDNLKYKDLDFNFLWLNGTDPDALNKIIEGFTPKENQTIIAFFDRDKAGSDCIKNALYKDKPDNFTKDSFKGDIKNGIHIYFYPKKDGFTQSNFEVEDYFPIEVLRKFVIKESQTFQGIKSKFNKNKFSKECKEEGFDKTSFDGFKKLFDLILEIKTNNSKK